MASIALSASAVVGVGRGPFFSSDGPASSSALQSDRISSSLNTLGRALCSAPQALGLSSAAGLWVAFPHCTAHE